MERDRMGPVNPRIRKHRFCNTYSLFFIARFVALRLSSSPSKVHSSAIHPSAQPAFPFSGICWAPAAIISDQQPPPPPPQPAAHSQSSQLVSPHATFCRATTNRQMSLRPAHFHPIQWGKWICGAIRKIVFFADLPEMLILRLLCLLVICILSVNCTDYPPPSSPFWSFANADGRRKERKVSITMGRYSERDGDRDMLSPPAQRLVAREGHLLNAGSTDALSPGGNDLDSTFSDRRIQPQHDAAPYTQIAHGQPQFPSLARPRQLLSDQQRAVPIISALPDTRAIDRFDTHLHRFASAAPPGSAPNRVVLPNNLVEGLRNGISMESFMRNPPRLMGESGGRMDESGPNGNKGLWTGEGEERKPKTVILTNERISAVGMMASGEEEQEVRGNKNGENERNRNDQVPLALPDFRHEDVRPAGDGERLGPQARFAGETNEYKEDWGKEFTRTGAKISQGVETEYFGPKRLTSGDGPANRLMGTGINPPPAGTRLAVGGDFAGRARQGGEWEIEQPQNARGRVTPYENAPEEVTGSRFRNVDEYFNAMNGGNRGRGRNRYVKMDLLNE